MARKRRGACLFVRACRPTERFLLTHVRQRRTMYRMTEARQRTPAITLGWRLRIAMEHAGLKAEDMARELDVHRGTITRWTHDVGAAPRGIYVRQWAELTGVPFAWLVGEPGLRRASDTQQASGRITREYVDTFAAA